MSSLQGKVIRYTLLPGILPRLKDFAQDGFFFTAVLIARVYAMAGLIPAGHPYLNPANEGRYGIRHVIAEAANNLKLSRKNSDQILIFFVVLIGLVLLLAQIAVLVLSFVMQPALAQSIDAILLNGHSPDQDLAFILMDRVFGVKNIFNSCISNLNVDCVDIYGNPTSTPTIYPSAFQRAMHQLFAYYSYGLFFVAVIMILYFVITITAETAQTGTPFGRRFNKAWVIPRLIVFSALLVPLNMGVSTNTVSGTDEQPTQVGGFNGAQIITFWAAKLGSNFATNGWRLFEEELAQGTALDERKLLAQTKVPELDNLARFLFVSRVCKVIEEAAYKRKSPVGATDDGIQSEIYDIQPYLVRPSGFNLALKDDEGNPINEQEFTTDHLPFLETDFREAVRFSNFGNITIRFGHHDPVAYTDMQGNVIPRCGEIKMSTADMDMAFAYFEQAEEENNDSFEFGNGESWLDMDFSSPGAGPLLPGDDAEPGESPLRTSSLIQEEYYKMLQSIWSGQELALWAKCFVEYQAPSILQKVPYCYGGMSATEYTNFSSRMETQINNRIKAVVQNIQNQNTLTIDERVMKRGWAGAAILFNTIADLNGKVTTAVFNIPEPYRYPLVMEFIAKQKSLQDETISSEDRYSPIYQGDKIANITAHEFIIADTLNNAFQQWTGSNVSGTEAEATTRSPFVDVMNFIFGSQGIFDMRENADVHPLAQLTSLGRGLMEATIRNIAIGIVGGGLAKLIGEETGAVASAITSFAASMGSALIAISFALFYVLPFMPFIYFFFAVGGWVKGLFEAMVGLPLWALAHIQVDGEGLPGRNASNGYFLILEIFLRPIMILFGLLASITIFSAMVSVLNDIFSLVVENVGGFSGRGPDQSTLSPDQIAFYRSEVDVFFFTVMYTIIVYMIGTSCFKLIDLIPNQILRWGGGKVKTFQEDAGDPASQLMQKSYMGTKLMAGQLKGGQLAWAFA